MHQTFGRENRLQESIPPSLMIETLKNTGNVLALQVCPSPTWARQ